MTDFPSDAQATDAAPALSLQGLAQQLAELAARVAALEAGRPAAPVAAAVPVVAADVAHVIPAAAPAVDGLTELRRLMQALLALGLESAGQEGAAADAQFEAFRALVHADRQNSPLLLIELRRYKWAPFLARVRDYLADPSAPGSFDFERLIPDRIDPRTEVVKAHVLVRNGRRMAPPVTFRRDAGAGGAFRIEAMSL
ncbi:MAG: hypothetical protein FJ100_08690 [Deltaproteobacteria bacterium]|nr:hypothetical protein [Deltaproteobacteria bacterium]